MKMKEIPKDNPHSRNISDCIFFGTCQTIKCLICHTQNLKIGGFCVLDFEVNLIQTFWFVKLYESQMYRTDKMIFHANLHSFTQCFTFSESALKHRNAEKYESCSSYSRPSALFGFKIESYCLYFRGMTLIFIKTANLSLFFFLVSHPRFNM